MENRNYRKLDQNKFKSSHKSTPREEYTEPSMEMVFGVHPVLEVLNSGKVIDRIYLQKSLTNPLILELQETAKKMQIPVMIVPGEKLDKITRKNHQGIICYISPILFSSLDNVISSTFEAGKIPLILILDKITDVRNFGAIARTAECAGVNCIIIPEKGSAQINADALKTSAGALNYIPICRESNLKNTIEFLKESGLQVVACTEKTTTDVYQIDFTVPTAIIMGSEDDGVSDEYLKRSTFKAKIPMFGKISSLNVSVATAIITYECIRQRKSLI